MLLFSVFFALAVPAAANTDGMGKVLRAYGPGGPAEALHECAELFP